MIFSRLVSASLSPNVQKDDVFLALRVLFSPTRWVTGNSRQMVEKWFAKFFNNSQVLTFNSGRSALFAILRAFGIGSGDEVIVQAFTCVAVPNSVVWCGATPVYVDIDKTFNIDPNKLERKITNATRAIIVQHTFGTPADMDQIMAIATKHKILVIEDCAHSLGATYKGRMVGSMGDAAAFSFGRDKIVSSVFGGLALIAKRHGSQWSRLKELHNAMPYPSGFWIVQQLVHPVAFALILPWYRMGVGKVFLFVLQKIGLLGFPVYAEEKNAHRPTVFPRKYPNALATLLLQQLKKLERYNKKRQAAANLYAEKLNKKDNFQLPVLVAGSVYLRYPILVSAPSPLLDKAKHHGILLGNWYHSIIDPTGVNFAKVSYTKGMCPVAEEAASRVINLPTNISEKEVLRVIKELRDSKSK